MKNQNTLGHIIALITIVIWSITFISTKIILAELTPVAILFYRFSIGYLVLWMLHPKIAKINSLQEELLFFCLGFTGIFLYYLLENIALQYTLAANVGLIISTAPILTAIVAHLATRDEKLSLKFLLGFFIAIAGVFLIIYNGHFVLKISPKGDFLALLAAAVWAIYSVLLKRVDPRLNQIEVVRKTFFYGLVWLIPQLIFLKPQLKIGLILLSGTLAFNILFLGLCASAFCFVTWTKAVKLIGVVSTSDYIYLVPLITMSTSMVVLHEKVNMLMILGGMLIIGGVYVTERGVFLQRLFRCSNQVFENNE